MSFFIKEAETEKWLESESRMLTMQDGSKVTFTDTRLMWRSVDFVTDKTLHWMPHYWDEEIKPVTLEQLIEKALEWSKRDNLDFSVTFPNMAVYIHRQMRWVMGIDPKPPEAYVWFSKK